MQREIALTDDEIANRGRKAGVLQYEILTLKKELALNTKATKQKISDLRAKMEAMLEEARRGVRYEDAQIKLFDGNERLDDVKEVVRKAREKHNSNAPNS